MKMEINASHLCNQNIKLKEKYLDLYKPNEKTQIFYNVNNNSQFLENGNEKYHDLAKININENLEVSKDNIIIYG